jgi:hypothetical protein
MDKRLNEILKEIGIYLIFLFFLFYVSFTNHSLSAKTYNSLFQNTFVQQQKPKEIGLYDVIF